jgi:hypothetical protein
MRRVIQRTIFLGSMDQRLLSKGNGSNNTGIFYDPRFRTASESAVLSWSTHYFGNGRKNVG